MVFKVTALVLLVSVAVGFLWYMSGANDSSQQNYQYQYSNGNREQQAGPSNGTHWDSRTDDNCRRRRRKRTSGTESCSICLNLIPGKDAIVLEPCSHVFHGPCIMEWMQKGPESMSKKCPICRASYRIGT